MKHVLPAVAGGRLQAAPHLARLPRVGPGDLPRQQIDVRFLVLGVVAHPSAAGCAR